MFPIDALLLGLQTAPGQLDGVADAIAEMKEVHYVAITTGAFDVFAWVCYSFSSKWEGSHSGLVRAPAKRLG